MAAEDVMVVFDGSNSMWGRIDGTAKIEIARDVMGNLLGDWTDNTNVGLIAYGHRREGDCSDIETVLAPQKLDRDRFLTKVGEISPRGKTPLTDAVEMAAEQLSYRDNPATVVLISDGIESCQRDPCALASELERAGVSFTAHVVGFGLSEREERDALACIAEETGGLFLSAGNAGELGKALSEVGTVVAEAPEPKPTPEPQPQSAPIVTLEAPDTTIMGSSFSVSWSASGQQPGDFVTIVPVGAEEGEHGDYARVKDKSSGRLQAPAEPGRYEVRYVVEDGRATAGSVEIEVVEANVAVEAPESTTAGATFPVSWSDVIHPRDFITIVPMDAEEGAYEDYTRVKDDREGTLQAPADAGLYEVRYVLNEGRKTLASAPIEIVEAEASVEAPERATAGETFSVSWSNAIHPRDFVTIVPAGADEGSYADYTRVKDSDQGSLQAPADAGLYEVRYVLNEGRKTLASAPIEIVEAEASVRAPDSAVVGSTFTVQWSRGIHPRDFVAIVPMGAEPGDHIDYARVSDKAEGKLRAPAESGLYEVRYVLNEGRKTLASEQIEIVEADIELSGPDTVRAGTAIRVGWSGTAPHPRDFVTIVPMGAEEGDYGDYARVGEREQADLAAPEATGLYEVRYVLEEGRRTLARHPVEVVAATATLNEGGALEVPETGAPGATVEVVWEAENQDNDQRIALAGADQADFTWIEARKADGDALTFTLPEEAGFYEFRLLDITERKVLSRATIAVE
ncbi:vWA domain-containing protein [Nitratireductor thuwali]|uniref:VWFA domain-containing protein n=1 Tax=Nitratireductor thuwali TaxID=2267699 RepID=A0ABY5MLT3_9HYPH|nr:hypothetical protein NTH_02676 [Nitratireductor thuwali]